MNLDPILVWPEVLDATGTTKRVVTANDVLGLIKSCVSTAEEADLVNALRQSLRQSGGVLKTFAQGIGAGRSLTHAYPGGRWHPSAANRGRVGRTRRSDEELRRDHAGRRRTRTYGGHLSRC
jgi:hypothetical protein